MIVLGVDPGTAATGFGVVSSGGGADDEARARGDGRTLMNPARFHLVECGVIRTRARDPLAARLRDVYVGIRELIERHHPAVLAVEDVFYARNVRTMLSLGHARGVILLAGMEAGLDIREYPPAEVKKAVVGRGAATKEQVQFMLTRLLRLRAAPQPADAADGVAAAVTCLLTVHLDRLRARARDVRREVGMVAAASREAAAGNRAASMRDRNRP